MAAVVAVFVADYDYDGSNQGELSFQENDHIKILNDEGDWWYGELVSTGERGWLAPSYGHTVSSISPYSNLSNSDKLERRKALFVEIIQLEATFISDLNIFIRTIVAPLQLRDTPFKRSFLNEPSIAVSLSLIRELFVTCSSFESGIKRAGSGDQMAKCYLQFAPSLQLFSQYASENASCLNTVKSFSRQLKDFSKENPLPPDLSLETCLVLPLNHYPKYSLNFQEFLWLTPSDKPEFASLTSALDEIIAQTEKVDHTLDDLAASVKLLALQSQFVGNPKIFTTTRKLIKEGELERVRTSAGNVAVKTYYAHLFNDALIWSQRNSSNGTYKLNKSMELNGASISEIASLVGLPNAFSLTGMGAVEVFRCARADESKNWFTEIEKVIDGFKVSKSDIASVGGDAMLSLNNNKLPSNNALGNRGACIHKFLATEMRLFDLLGTLNITVFKPLFEASRGAALQVNKSNVSKSSESSSASKVQGQAITEALKAPDVQLFLRSAELLVSGLKDLLDNLRDQCVIANWSENISIGNVFNSPQAKILYSQYKSYAEKQQSFLRIIQGPFFVQFYGEAEHRMSGYPGTLDDNLGSPKKRPTQYLEFLNQLLQITPLKHPDRNDLQIACQTMSTVANEVERMVKNMKNFDKLLEIQASLVVSSSVFSSSNDPSNFVQTLASTERRFIKEGDLKKVCRKQNKTFRFWLFNDYLCYGNSSGSSTFTFHRALTLSKCRVQEHSGDLAGKHYKHCFEFLGSEKSFVVIAASDTQRMDWIDKINRNAEQQRQQLGINDESFNPAAVWEQDNGRDSCCICDQSFGIFRRRHHCRKCGKLVCGDHSLSKEILFNIDKIAKQRVCDKCVDKNAPVETTSRDTIDSLKSAGAGSRSSAGTTASMMSFSTAQLAASNRNNPNQLLAPPSRNSNSKNVADMSRSSSHSSVASVIQVASSPRAQQAPQISKVIANNDIDSQKVVVGNLTTNQIKRSVNVSSIPATVEPVIARKTMMAPSIEPPAKTMNSVTDESKDGRLIMNLKKSTTPTSTYSEPLAAVAPLTPNLKRPPPPPSTGALSAVEADSKSVVTPSANVKGISSTVHIETKDTEVAKPISKRPPPPPPTPTVTSAAATDNESISVSAVGNSVKPPPPPPSTIPKAFSNPTVAIPVETPLFITSPPHSNESTTNVYNNDNDEYANNNLFVNVDGDAEEYATSNHNDDKVTTIPDNVESTYTDDNDSNGIADNEFTESNNQYIEPIVDDDTRNSLPIEEAHSHAELSTAVAPPNRPNLASFLTPESLASVKLSHDCPALPPPSAPLRPPNVKPPSLLEALQQGTSKLKKVTDEVAHPAASVPAKAGAGNVLSMLADQMSKRRVFVQDNSDDESDSDDGFSSDED